MSPAQRVAVLRNWDAALEEHYQPTRAHADLLTKKRSLEDLHWALTRAGR
jgi:hypothetical protein